MTGSFIQFWIGYGILKKRKTNRIMLPAKRYLNLVTCVWNRLPGPIFPPWEGINGPDEMKGGRADN